MDIKAKIEEIVKKLQSDKALQEAFRKDPVKALESLLGVDLPDDQIHAIINGVKAKLDLDKLSGALGKLGFGK
ncbi:MAG: hypothetical protein PUF71_00825 [Firmicutes bacterium]|nr:hypothetical protein [Bacillota bacterium]